MTICAASVARIITNIVASRFHNGRTTRRSDHNAEHGDQRDREHRGHGQRQPVGLERNVGEHAAQHHERALGEIHDAAGIVDDAEADADQPVDAADRRRRSTRIGTTSSSIGASAVPR